MYRAPISLRKNLAFLVIFNYTYNLFAISHYRLVKINEQINNIVLSFWVPITEQRKTFFRIQRVLKCKDLKGINPKYLY